LAKAKPRISVTETGLDACADKALHEEGSKLGGIYAGNPKRTTGKPTTEMMLDGIEMQSGKPVVKMGEP